MHTYDPYGKVTIRDVTWQPVTWDASQKNVCLYTGHKFDAESGLYYSIYRYYHPGLGRWATRDPIGEIAIGQLQRFNIRTSDDQSQTRAEIARVLNVRTLTNEKRSSLTYLMNNSLSHIDALGLFEIVVTKPATPGTCEACTFEVEFKVTKADPKDKTKKDDPNGWIIQHVKLESNEPRKCDHPHDIVKPAKNIEPAIGKYTIRPSENVPPWGMFLLDAMMRREGKENAQDGTGTYRSAQALQRWSKRSTDRPGHGIGSSDGPEVS